MRILGIEIMGSVICWLVLDGELREGHFDYVTPSKQGFPESEDSEFGNLITLKQLISATLTSERIDIVGVIAAGRDSSILRTKIECMIQLAAHENNKPCKLIHVNTINAAMKRKFGETVGDTIENSFNQKKQISPNYLLKAAYCAWCVFND